MTEIDSEAATGKLDDLIGYNLRRASTLMLSDFSAMFSDTFLRPTSFSIACVIDEQPGITSAEIRRVDDADDKRIQRLYLNERKKADLRAWREMAERHEDRMLNRLTDQERAVLLGMLKKIWRDGEAND